MDLVVHADLFYSIGVSYECLHEHEKSLEFYLKSYELRKSLCGNKNHLLVAANIAKVTDDILRPGSFKRAPSYFGYGLGYGFESILGPAQLMYTKSPLNGPGAVFFTLGFPF